MSARDRRIAETLILAGALILFLAFILAITGYKL